MYLSGYLFYLSCDASIDDRYAIKSYNESTRRLFLKYSDIHLFLKNPVKKKIDIVYHNSDESFTQELAEQLRPYCNHIFAVNCVTQLNYVTQIPLSLRDDAYLPHSGLETVLRLPEGPRNIFCYANFLIDTNRQKRIECLQWASKQDWVTKDTDYFYVDLRHSLNHKHEDIIQRQTYFWNSLRQSMFVLCPPGTGIDTHRVYESLLCGAIPIVLKSPISLMQESFGAMVVNSWDDLSEELCKRFYKNRQPRKDFIKYTAEDFLVNN
jgi:hypothetical protein